MTIQDYRGLSSLRCITIIHMPWAILILTARVKNGVPPKHAANRLFRWLARAAAWSASSRSADPRVWRNSRTIDDPPCWTDETCLEQLV